MYINLNSTIYINTAYQMNYLSENGDFFFSSFTIYKNFQDLHELQRKSSKKVYNRISYQLYTSYEWYIILTQFISKDIKNMYLP